MKKIYYFMLMSLFVVFVSKAEKILVVGVESTNANYVNHMAVIDSVAAEIGTLDGITTEIVDADVVTSGTFDFSGYDAMVITEAASSSVISKIGTYTDDVVSSLPVLNMKMYAIHAGKNGWNWCPQADFYGNYTNWDSEKIVEESVMEILVEHEIFGCAYSVGDKIQLFASSWESGAHFQGCTFENSAVSDIKSNATAIGSSTFIESEDDTKPSFMMWAIEENGTCPRNVILGIHNYFTQPTDDFKKILKNSLLWILEKEISGCKGIEKQNNGLGVNAYPNPASAKFNFEFDLNTMSSVAISIFDLTGKIVHSTSAFNAVGFQTESIDISQFTKGIYMYLVNINGKTLAGKLVIE